MTINYLDSKRLQGLSADTKPTNVQTNSLFEQTDNSIRYWYDGNNWMNNPTRGVFMGGSGTNVMDYVTIATTGNAIDFGDFTLSRYLMAGLNSAAGRGVFGGGHNGDAAWYNTMDYITIATTGNATDFGDLSVARGNNGGLNSDVRGVFGGGTSPSNSNVMDYITIATTGNATDFGDLIVAGGGASCGVNSITRGMFAGQSTTNIDYITIATTGNAIDFGDLTTSRVNSGGVQNGI